MDDPVYMLDRDRGFCRIKTASEDYIEIKSLKHINRDAFDNNYFEIRHKGKSLRLQKDELLAALQYV